VFKFPSLLDLTAATSHLHPGRSGRVNATTEPSFVSCSVGNQVQEWRYFAYIVQIHYNLNPTDSGDYWNVGRVKLP